MTETIKINGFTFGDQSVGIGTTNIHIDTGLTELTEQDRKFIEETIIRDLWELHDNGDLDWEFSDEKKENLTYKRRMNKKLSGEILKRRQENDRQTRQVLVQDAI